MPDWADSVWHLYVVRHAKRDTLQKNLADRGVGTLIHYPVPPHLSGAYAEDGFKPGMFPIAEELAQTVLSLPMGPHLRSEQARAVVAETNAAASGL